MEWLAYGGIGHTPPPLFKTPKMVLGWARGAWLVVGSSTPATIRIKLGPLLQSTTVLPHV